MDELLKILRNNNKIYESHPYEDPDFDGEPAATITPSGNSGSYNTTSENERVYAFTVRLFIDRETSISGKTLTKMQIEE